MEKVPHQNDSPKGSAKKIVFEINDLSAGLENLPSEASELMKNIMSTDAFIKNTPCINEKIMIEAMTAEQAMTKAPHMDQHAQDLLRRMVMQEKLTENDSQRVSDSGYKINADDSIKEEKLVKSKSSPPPPPPPPTTSPPPPPPPTISKSMLTIFDKKEFIINENGSIFDIQINNSKRKDVVEIMKLKSEENKADNTSNTLKYDDLGINFHFGSGGIVQEITFNYPFEGKTSKGLRIDDSINKAIQLYGQPNIRTQSGAIWSKIALFLKDDFVTTIRLRSTDT